VESAVVSTATSAEVLSLGVFFLPDWHPVATNRARKRAHPISVDFLIFI
jgi:hypothetical protein